MRITSLARILIGCAVIVSLAACNSNSLPGGGIFNLQTHLYVQSNGNTYLYQLPLTASSTPLVTLSTGGGYLGLTVSQNKLYVAAGSNVVKVFQLPLTSSSTPIQTLTLSASNALSLAADSSGTIYVAEDQSGSCCVDVFQGGASTPTFTLSGASVDAPFGVAIDSGGNAFVANNGNIGYFAAPVHSGQAGITFGRNNFNEGLVTDGSDNLYVADGGGIGTMDVYHPPYTTGTTVSSTVTIVGAIEQMAMSSTGTMYLAMQTPNQLDVRTSPYTSVSLSVPTPFAPYGIAVGP